MKKIAIILISLVVPALICRGGIVPEPSRLTPGKGSLKISGAVFKCDPSIDSVSMDAICRLAARLSLVSGKTSSVSTPVGLRTVVDDGSAKGVIFLRDNSLKGESYRISVGQKSALVEAGGTEGFLNAIQTIKQMLPAEIYGEQLAEKCRWALPRCEISDSPSTALRGLCIDSCENFWSVEQILSCLDLMARYKYNCLLWKVAGERGWRMEVKAFPLLGQAGGYRMEGDRRYGGYYGREDLTRIVSHATSLGINIIPSLHIGKEVLTLLRPQDITEEQFLSKILEETAAIFPCAYEDVNCDVPLPPGALEAAGKQAAPGAAAGFLQVSASSPDEKMLRELAEKLW